MILKLVLVTKEEIVKTLVERDLNMDGSSLAQLLRYGFPGYDNMTIYGLIKEYIHCNGVIDTFVVVDENDIQYLVDFENGQLEDITKVGHRFDLSDNLASEVI